MANTSLSISNLSSILTTSWQRDFVASLNAQTPLLNLFKTKQMEFPAGSSHYIRQQTDRNVQFAAISAGGTLPQKGKPAFDRYTISTKYLGMQFAIDGPTLAQALGSKNNMADMLVAVQNDCVASAKKQMERMLFGDGKGKLGIITAYNAGTYTFAATGDKTKLNRYIKKGMYLAVHDNSNDTVRGATTISATPNYTATTCVGDTVGGTDADDYVCLAVQGGTSSLNNEIWGLEYHVDDSTNITTYQGVTRANVDVSKASVLSNSGTNRALTKPLMQQAYRQREVKTNRSGTDEMIIICDLALADEYSKFTEGQVQFAPMANDNGYGQLPTFNGKKIIAMTDCPYHNMYFVSPNDFTLFTYKDWKFGDVNGTVLHMDSGSTNTDSHWGVLLAYLNLGCEQPNAQTKITDLTMTPNYAN